MSIETEALQIAAELGISGARIERTPESFSVVVGEGDATRAMDWFIKDGEQFDRSSLRPRLAALRKAISSGSEPVEMVLR